MPDENRFARLGDAIGESDDGDDGPEEEEAESNETASAESTPEPDAADEATAPGEGTDDDGADDSPAETADGPAFEFEETTAKSVYVRPETVAVLDDAEFEVESHLRREHDVRDMTGREFHDAVVRVAAEHPEKVAEAILDARDGGE